MLGPIQKKKLYIKLLPRVPLSTNLLKKKVSLTTKVRLLPGK